MTTTRDTPVDADDTKLFEPDVIKPGVIEPDVFDPDDYGPTGHPRTADAEPADRGYAADEPPRPINWNLLTADEAESEWLDLNAWVHWLRGTYGLPPTVIAPFWHRHDELVWELSALHTHWRNAYDPDGSPSSPLAWHRDFADARPRLREWVSTCGTKLDRDRPTRTTRWPGEEPADPDPSAGSVEVVIEDREADFIAHVLADVAARRRIQQRAQEHLRAVAPSP